MSEKKNIVLTLEDIEAEGDGYFPHKRVSAEKRKSEQISKSEVEKESTKPKINHERWNDPSTY